jgi:hypothetical protein
VPFLHSNYSVLEALFSQIRSLNHDTPKKYISSLGSINTSQCIQYLDRNKMCLAYTVGNVMSVDPIMEAQILCKSKHCTATINQWRLYLPMMAHRAVGCFEGTYEIKNKLLADLFSILKEDTVQNGFANFLITSDNLFEEFAFASLFTLREQWYECVFTMELEHRQGFNKVCQRIEGDLFGIFEATLFAPNTTATRKSSSCMFSTTSRDVMVQNSQHNK